MTESYPLHWPDSWPRTEWPDWSKFKPGGFTKEARLLIGEIERLGGTDIIISSNVEIRLDGLPYSSRRAPDDAGVAVYFNLDGRSQCIPCDRWATVEENCRAIWKSVEALRGLDRWGAKSFVEAAFRGFQALPPPTARTWQDVLKFRPGCVLTRNEVEDRYRHLARECHPDNGGSNEAMAELNAAIREARKAVA